jgi:hypothetical protein
MPTFYKAFEGMLIGDNVTEGTKAATAMESYLSKLVNTSISDASQDSLFNYEQLGQMVTSVFAQIYQQRAAASLSKVVNSSKNAAFDAKLKEVMDEPAQEFIQSLLKSGVPMGKDEQAAVFNTIATRLPGLKALKESQSQLAKSLNLGYMALVTTADIYGEALESGYDRRTAGFAAVAAAAGQYGIMMNNGMGDWFLDKTTGYDINTNKALLGKTVKDIFKPVSEAFKTPGGDKKKLGSIFKEMRLKLEEIFTNPSELGENLFKHSIIEGVEEVTEQAVLDTTKGMIDVMSYLGLTKSKGSFGGFSNVFSAEGGQEYLANLIGGMIGGPMFEYNTARIEPRMRALFSGDSKVITPDVKQSLYQLIINGQGDDIIAEVEKQRKYLGNSSIAYGTVEGEDVNLATPGKSQADVIADTTIGIVKALKAIFHSNDLVHTTDEIVKKAFIDHKLLKTLEKVRGDNKLGIEGLILEDYAEVAKNLVDINLGILELSQTEEDKVKNKEAIKQLTDEAKIYKEKKNNILDGKNSQFYFDQVMTYLQHTVSDTFLTIDRDTYAKKLYGKSYYDLPETSIGITKEKLNKKWRDYVESKDLRKHLEVITKTYLEIEKNINKAAVDFTESGYDIEQRKTFKNLINVAATFGLFGTSDKTKGDSYKQFIATAKELESTTGKKILP